jgi:hypothetical protein
LLSDYIIITVALQAKKPKILNLIAIFLKEFIIAKLAYFLKSLPYCGLPSLEINQFHIVAFPVGEGVNAQTH